MAEWTDSGISLGLRRFGETGAILEVFGRDHGRRRGMIYGGASQKKRAVMQAGNTLSVTWRARQADSLGHFAVAEPERERSALYMRDPGALTALSAVADLLAEALPEGEARPDLFDGATTLLDLLGEPDVWPALFIKWEVGLLTVMGFGIDTTRCALTGAPDGLTHVSPKSGRAVRGDEAGEYLDRLLPLPAFLVDSSAAVGPEDVAAGFRLTGYFLSQRLFADLNKPVPEARGLMIDRLERAGKLCGATH